MKVKYKNKFFYDNSHRFDKWFDPDTFNWQHIYLLVMHCSDHFDKWFDSETFDWGDSYYLVVYCPEHFHKWFDPDKIDWEFCLEYLEKHCNEYREYWEDAYKLMNV
jgi:hypothetical protein